MLRVIAFLLCVSLMFFGNVGKVLGLAGMFFLVVFEPSLDGPRSTSKH